MLSSFAVFHLINFPSFWRRSFCGCLFSIIFYCYFFFMNSFWLLLCSSLLLCSFSFLGQAMRVAALFWRAMANFGVFLYTHKFWLLSLQYDPCQLLIYFHTNGCEPENLRLDHLRLQKGDVRLSPVNFEGKATDWIRSRSCDLFRLIFYHFQISFFLGLAWSLHTLFC